MTQSIEDLKGLSVKEIAERRGIGMRYAYELHQRVNRPPEVEVPENQKVAILETLSKGDAATLASLQQRVYEGGVHLDTHSLTHVIWSLQKQRLVRFRERKNGPVSNGATLTAIKLTPNGRTYLHEHSFAASAVVAAPAPPEPPEPEPPVTKTVDPTAFPFISELIDRAERGEIVRQAASLLEQAGEEIAALELLERHTLTPLEEEIVRFVKR